MAQVAKYNQQPTISLAQNHLLKAHGEKDCAGALRRKQEMEQNPSSSLFFYQPLPISSTMSIFLFFLSSCNIANKNPSLVCDHKGNHIADEIFTILKSVTQNFKHITVNIVSTTRNSTSQLVSVT